MPETAAIDAEQFNRIARRNVTLPLYTGIISVLSFLLFVWYFMVVNGWVDHTHQVIGKLNELTTLQSDMEGSMRGYVITGDESFLAPFQVAKPQMASELDELVRQTVDNPSQTERLRRVQSLQQAWQAFALWMMGFVGPP